MISQNGLDRLTWTWKTSSAKTGLYEPAPPDRKGFAVALVRVLATSSPTVACRPNRVATIPVILIQHPRSKFARTSFFRIRCTLAWGPACVFM